MTNYPGARKRHRKHDPTAKMRDLVLGLAIATIVVCSGLMVFLSVHAQ